MKRLLIIVLVLGAIGAGWVLYSRASGGESPGLPEGITTAPVVRDTFEATVSATGSVRAERTQRLAFNTSGTVAEIMVEEGDEVVAGQVLARLDDANLALSVRQAEAALAIAQAQLARTEAGPSAEEIAAAEASLTIAQVGVQTAEAGVAAARANLSRVRAGASEQELAIAARRIEEAKNALWGVQAQRDSICGRVGFAASQADCDQAQASVQRSEEAVRIAELQLEQTEAGPRASDIASAQAQLDQALSQLESARAQVVRAEVDQARVMRGATAQDIAISEAQVAQARVNVEIAERRLDDAVLRAPAEGRIATLTLLVGDAATPGNPVATLVDTERYHVLVSIDETEIGQIEEGQEVRVTLDAYLERPLQGRIASVGLTGTNVQGIVVYDVRVDLEPDEVAIRPLMTAAVDIVVARKADALLVSSRALRRDAQGRYVEIVENGVLRRVDVQVGVSNVEFAEILSGLEEGQEVVVGRPRDSLFSFGFGGG
jgi:RND family efflux transporter MFP subunit